MALARATSKKTSGKLTPRKLSASTILKNLKVTGKEKADAYKAVRVVIGVKTDVKGFKSKSASKHSTNARKSSALKRAK